MPYLPNSYRRRALSGEDDLYTPADNENGLPDVESALPEGLDASAPADPAADPLPKLPSPDPPKLSARTFTPPRAKPSPEPSAPPEIEPASPQSAPPAPQQPARAQSYGQQEAAKLGAPPQPKPAKWWQRLAAAGVGGMAGYINASGHTRISPDQIKSTEENILHPGYAGELADYNRKRQYVSDVLDQENAQRGRDIQEEQLANLRENRTALRQHEERTEQDRVAQNKALNDQRALDGARKAFQALKGRQTPTYHDPGEPVAPGYAAITDPDVPGKVAWVRAGMRPAPKELVDAGYLPGFKVGDQVPLEDLDAATKTYRDDIKQQNKPGKDIEGDTQTRSKLADQYGLTGQDRKTFILTGQIHQPPAAAGAGVNLTPDALDMAALTYLRTGQLPSFGMGSAAGVAKSKVINRAAELQPGGDIALNKADYKAMSDSLAKLQVQKNTVGAFEKTAGKNIDVFLQQAKGMIDTKSPVLNQVFRGGQRALTGGLEGFDAARITAFTEISRVLSGSMGVLSDSARHEAESIIQADYTIEGLYRAANVLRNDMRNRMQSYDQQIGEVQEALRKSRPGGNTGGPPQPIAPSRKIPVTAGGKTFYFDTQAQADQFKREAGVK